MKSIAIAWSLCVLCAGAVRAEETPRYIQFGIDVSSSWTLGDGSELWTDGTGFGLAGFYPLTPWMLLGLRAGYDRWSIDVFQAGEAAKPPGASIVFNDTFGEFRIYEVTPTIRISRSKLLFDRLGAFVQGGAGYYHVRFNVESVVGWDDGGGTEVTIAQGDGADHRFGVSGAGGVTFEFSKESWFDVFPWYRVIFEDEGNIRYWGLLIGFRVAFAPWDES